MSVTMNDEYLFENYKLTNYSINQPIVLKLRSSIIDWLFVINRTLSDTPYTFFHAMKIFDSFVSLSASQLNQNDIQLYAAVCYFISKKFNEVVMMSVAFVSKNILKNKYTSSDVIQTEISLLKSIRFHIGIDTPYSYTSYLIYLISQHFDLSYIELSSIDLSLSVFFENLIDLYTSSHSLDIALSSLFAMVKILRANKQIDEEKEKRIGELLRKVVKDENKESVMKRSEALSVTMCEIVREKKSWLRSKMYFKNSSVLIGDNDI